MGENKKIYTNSILFSLVCLFYAIFLFRLRAGVPALFSMTIMGAAALNAFWPGRTHPALAGHLLNILLQVFAAGICLWTGGVYSIAIFLLFFVPLFATLLENTWEMTSYVVSAVFLMGAFYFGSRHDIPMLTPELMINLGYYRLEILFVMFAAFATGIFCVVHAKEFKKSLELKKSLEECDRIREESENSLKVKDEFMANMSHEIRNPMNGIIGMMHVLLDSDLDEEQRSYSKIVYNSALALLSIVNDVLDLSKIEAGKLELDIIHFDLEVTIEDMMSLPMVQARQKGIEFACDIDPQVPRLLKGDVARIRQVLNNLAGNAIKFTDAGQVTVNITLESEIDQTATLHFSVEDTGIGIKEEVLARLFTSFTQADASITKKYGGTGLGLAISKLLVEKMGGQIGADSIEMIGSTFWFTLPLEKQSGHEIMADPFCQDLGACKVMVLTDGANLGRNFERNLGFLRINYEQAFDETEAVEILKWAAEENDPFSLIIVEAKESDNHARALGKQLLDEPGSAQIPKMLLSSVGEKGHAKQFENLGYCAFLSKPVERFLLEDAIKAVLARTQEQIRGESVLPIITRYSILERKKQLKSILIVEDMETNRLTAAALIKKLGYQTDEAVNGADAVEKVIQNSYELVLMDCQMPEMDGYEATARIREMEARKNRDPVPIVAMTGNAFDSDRQKCLDCGMDDFIAKPVDPEVLAQTIRRNLRTPVAGYMDAFETSDIPEDLPDPSSVLDFLHGLDGEDLQAADGTDPDAPLSFTGDAYDAQDTGNSGRESVGDETIADEAVALCFNRQMLAQRFGGDQEMMDLVVDAFLEEAVELLDSIDNAITKDRHETVRTSAHALKGAAANVNADMLSKAALALETLARNDQALGYSEALSVVKKEYDNFKQEVQL